MYNKNALYRIAADNTQKDMMRYNPGFNGNPKFTFTLDIDGQFKDFTNNVPLLIGYSADELHSLTIFSLITDITLEKTKLHFYKLKQGESVKLETKVVHKNGKILDLVATAVPIEENGHVIGVFGFAEDVTEMKKTERQLAKIKYALDVSSIYFTTNKKGYITDANENLCRITKYDKHELLGQSSKLFSSGDHDDLFFQEMWKTVKSNKIWEGEIKNKAKDGSIFWVNSMIIPFMDVEESDLSYIAFQKDITERKLTEEIKREEIELAKSVQEHVLSKPITNDRIEIHRTYIPSEQLSGDMYVWYQIDTNRYGILLFDVMGHGVAASLISMSLQSLLRGIIFKCKEPIDVVTELNNHLFNLYHQENLSTYLTALYLLVDTKNKTVEYVNAGHPHGIAVKSCSDIIVLDKGGIPVGLSKIFHLEKGVLSYDDSIQILLYTDGLYETEINNDLAYFHSQLSTLVNQFKDIPNEEVLAKILEKLNIGKETKQHDDISLISISIS